MVLKMKPMLMPMLTPMATPTPAAGIIIEFINPYLLFHIAANMMTRPILEDGGWESLF